MNRRLFALSCLAIAATPAPANATVRSRLQSFRRRAWRSRLGLFGLAALAIGIPIYLGKLVWRDEPRPWDKH